MESGGSERRSPTRRDGGVIHAQPAGSESGAPLRRLTATFNRTRPGDAACKAPGLAATFAAMFTRIITCAALLGGLQLATADVVQLRDKASVSGKILAEKRDLVIVDLGYSVLSIPKSSIIRITRDTDAEPKQAKGKTAAPAVGASNWRIIFRFEAGHARDVALIDYH